MTIRFVPNDPRATKFNDPTSMRARRNRKKTVANFVFGTMPKQAEYPEGSVKALAWQSREAALAAVEMFEGLHGPVKQWARSPNRKRLAFAIDAGEDVNAYYDGDGVLFFHQAIGNSVLYTGASTDIVSHEVGHALLDTIRPELWDANFLEAAAFHEAFGDCVAMLTALADSSMRKALARKATLGKKNFVETFGEELAWMALKMFGAQENSAKPRQALNKYDWALPSTLPGNGPGGVLINEPHSFGQVFTGCFYDLIRLIFARAKSETEASLWNATSAAAQLLFGAAKTAPLTPRFFQAIGRTMVLQDGANGGALRDTINKAFGNHGIALGAAALGAPRATLAGAKFKRLTANAATLSPATAQDLRRRLGAAKGGVLHTRAVKLGDRHMAEVSHVRHVDLSGLASYLKGVSAAGAEPVLVGAVRGTMAVMSSLPDSASTEEEVRTFVSGLVEHDAILPAARAVRARGARAATSKEASRATHRVVARGGTKVLERRGFSCGCGCHG